MSIKLDMSIEETIEHLDQIAKNQFECADRIDELHCDSTSTRYMASYHKRLAEWLKELKAYRVHMRAYRMDLNARFEDAVNGDGYQNGIGMACDLF